MCFEIEGLYSTEYRDYSMRPHRHAAIEIMYVEHGKCEVNIHNPPSPAVTHVPLLANNFIILNAGVYHDLHVPASENCGLKTIEFNLSGRAQFRDSSVSLEQLLDHSIVLRTLLNDRKPYLVLCDTVKLIRVMSDIIHLHDRYKWHPPDDKYMLMQMKIGELFLQINDCVPVSGVSNVGLAYIRRSQQLIRQQLFSPELTPDVIAREIGITKHYLMSLYQKHLNHTVLHEIQSLRVEHACSRILNTADKLIDIGFSCGFNTRQSFFNTFKKMTGVSPQQFRSRYSRISTYLYAEWHDDEL